PGASTVGLRGLAGSGGLEPPPASSEPAVLPITPAPTAGRRSSAPPPAGSAPGRLRPRRRVRLHPQHHPRLGGGAGALALVARHARGDRVRPGVPPAARAGHDV